MTVTPLRLHATCVALDGQGVLLCGPPGSGKSDLALRLIDGGARLVVDDLCELRRVGGQILAGAPARAPAEARGRLEVRGLGILPVPSQATAPLRLAVLLTPADRIERLPEAAYGDYLGIAVPRIALDPFAASAAAKVRLAVRALPGVIMPPE